MLVPGLVEFGQIAVDENAGGRCSQRSSDARAFTGIVFTDVLATAQGRAGEAAAHELAQPDRVGAHIGLGLEDRGNPLPRERIDAVVLPARELVHQRAPRRVEHAVADEPVGAR